MNTFSSCPKDIENGHTFSTVKLSFVGPVCYTLELCFLTCLYKDWEFAIKLCMWFLLAASYIPCSFSLGCFDVKPPDINVCVNMRNTDLKGPPLLGLVLSFLLGPVLCPRADEPWPEWDAGSPVAIGFLFGLSRGERMLGMEPLITDEEWTLSAWGQSLWAWSKLPIHWARC